MLAATMYPELIPDIEKVHWLIRNAIHATDHYSRVVGEVGQPRAVILTHMENNLWAMKKNASVLLWYSDIPGAGAMLLRGFKRWVKEQGNIVLAGFVADWVQMDTRPLLLAERIGFKQRGGGYFYFPRGSKA
jgi:hypothetical protein